MHETVNYKKEFIYLFFSHGIPHLSYTILAMCMYVHVCMHRI